MSSESMPINPARFAAALKDLPLSALHGKAAELRNSLKHLESSNDQLKAFADDGDADCADAIRENVDVMARFRGRIDMLKAEVEERGMPWVEEDQISDFLEDREGRRALNGYSETDEQGATTAENGNAATNETRPSGRLTDEELQRRLQQQMDELGEEEEDDDGGMHL